MAHIEYILVDVYWGESDKKSSDIIIEFQYENKNSTTIMQGACRSRDRMVVGFRTICPFSA